MARLIDINGIGPALARRLGALGITTIEAVASATPMTLAKIQGLSETSAAKVIAEARKAEALSATPQKASLIDQVDDDMLGRLTKLDGLVQQLAARLEAVETDLKVARSARTSKGGGKARRGESKKKKKKKKKKK